MNYPQLHKNGLIIFNRSFKATWWLANSQYWGGLIQIWKIIWLEHSSKRQRGIIL